MARRIVQLAEDARKRTVEDAVAYALAHGLRAEILGYLHEQPRSPSELAKLLGQSLSKVEHHVKELAASGSIELARVEAVRNTSEHFYRAVEPPSLADEETWALPPEARQEVCGLILQASVAEGQAAFRAGKMSNDPRTWLAWRWFNLDAQGRSDLADELARSWGRIEKIAAESTRRRAGSGEELVSIVVCTQGFERSRNSIAPPLTGAE